MSELYKGEPEASPPSHLHRVLTQVLKKYEEEDGRYLICGTNAYKPECRDYVEVTFTFSSDQTTDPCNRFDPCFNIQSR